MPSIDEISRSMLDVLRLEYPDALSTVELFEAVLNKIPDSTGRELSDTLNMLRRMGYIATNISFNRRNNTKDIYSKYRITPEGIEAMNSGVSFAITPRPAIADGLEVEEVQRTGIESSARPVKKTEKDDIKDSAQKEVELVKTYEKMEKRMAEMQKQIDEHESTIGAFYTKSIELFAAFVGIFSFIVVYLNSVIPNLPGSDDIDKLVLYSIAIIGIFICVFMAFFYLLNRFVLKNARKQ